MFLSVIQKIEYVCADATQLTIGLHPNKPSESLKYHKLKMHLVHLTYQTLYFNLVFFKCAQNTILPTVG